MAQPVSSPITSPPNTPAQPYSAADSPAEVRGGWEKVRAGPCDPADFSYASGEDWPDSPPWRQT